MLKLYFLPLSLIVGAFEKLHPDIAKTLAVMYVSVLFVFEVGAYYCYFGKTSSSYFY